MSQTPREQASSVMASFPGVTQLPPGNPQVILAFHGLMLMRYINGVCELAMHANVPRHKFAIKVFDLASGSSEPVYSRNFGTAGSSPISEVNVIAEHADPAGVSFFKPVNFQFATPTHPRIVEDPLDFRQVNDLEGPEFYAPDRLNVRENRLRPTINVRTGVFVTLIRTDKDFKRRIPGDSLDLSKVAEYVGAGIYLQPNGKVSLEIADEELTFPVRSLGETLYVILFENSCLQSVCNFQPESNDRHTRNDFFEYFQLFPIPAGKQEFELLLSTLPLDRSAAKPAANAVLSAYERAAIVLKGHNKDSSNDAPCGPVGLGGG